MAALARADAFQRARARVPASVREAGREQAGVAAGQLGAGLGNLAFTLAMARVLAPAAFAHLAAFLALYLLVNLPASSISAGVALGPGRTVPGRATRRWLALTSLGLGAAVAAASPALAPLLGLPLALVLVLGLATPAVAPLAYYRGRLYGWRRHRRVVASLLAEPAVRLGGGVALAASLGATGAAVGVVVAGYAALEVARRPLGHHARRRAPARGATRLAVVTGSGSQAAAPARPRAAGTGPLLWTTASFLLLAILQSQDVLFANRLLPPAQAGAYAALSTMGGIAAFATATIPLVLLPRASDGNRHALAVALGAATALGGVAVVVALAVPGLLTATLFGSRYHEVAALAAPYIGAMALLGVARVLIAHRCATAAPRLGVALLASVVAAQDVAILAGGRTVGAIALTTLGATGTLTVALGAVALARQPWAGRRARSLASSLASPTTLALVGICAAGLGIRFVIPRGIWLDEATSIYQAQMPFGQMLQNLRSTDVHPPLYFAILWATVRLSGSIAATVMRVPSIIAGALVVPAAYVAARDIWDRRTGVVAALICMVAPLLVWYSQEARMYSMFMLFAVLAVWGQVRALRWGRWDGWAVFALASAALGWTEYFGLLQVGAQQLVFAGYAWGRRRSGPDLRRLLVGWALSGAVILALLVPLAPFAWHQFLVNQAAGKGFGATPSQVGLPSTHQLSIYAVLANVVWAVWGYHSAATMAALVALWPLGLLLALFLLGRNRHSLTTLVLVAAGVPALLLVGVGLEKRGLFDIRYLSGMVVLLLLLLARLITGATRSRWTLRAACLVLVATLAAGLVDEQVNGSNPRRYDFRSALQAVDARYRPGDLLVYDPGDLGLVVRYYSPHVASRAYRGDHAPLPEFGRDLFVLASKRLMQGDQAGQLGRTLSHLEAQDRLVETVRRANVTVWVFRHTLPAPRAVRTAGG